MPTSRADVQSVGIDVSKDSLDVALVRTDRVVNHIQFTNSKQGVAKLVASLQQHGTAATVPCVIESTGDLHLLTALTVARAGFTVNVINPLITKRYQRASIRGAKTDAIDAKRLADIGTSEDNLAAWRANIANVNAKKAISLLATLTRARQQLTASFKQWKKTQATLQLPLKVSGTEKILKTIDQQIKELNSQLVDYVPPTLRVLAGQMPGISVTQLAILAAATNGATFETRDQLVAFFGLDIKARRSGQWRGREKLSKRGNPFVRKILYQIAWGLKQHNVTYQAYYDRLYHEQNKHYNTTLIAIARKFLRFFFAYYCKGTVALSTVS